MFINKTAYYKAGRLMKLRCKCRIKPWEEGKVFIFVIGVRMSEQEANEMRGEG